MNFWRAVPILFCAFTLDSKALSAEPDVPIMVVDLHADVPWQVRDRVSLADGCVDESHAPNAKRSVPAPWTAALRAHQVDHIAPVEHGQPAVGVHRIAELVQQRLGALHQRGPRIVLYLVEG